MTQWSESCSREPTLKDMLDDPIVLELMESDHVARRLGEAHAQCVDYAEH
jgi:hypothetical protein